MMEGDTRIYESRPPLPGHHQPGSMVKLLVAQTHVRALKDLTVLTQPHILIWSGKKVLTYSATSLKPSGRGGSVIILMEMTLPAA